MVQHYIGQLHLTPPMVGCPAKAMASYVRKLEYRVKIEAQSSSRPAGEIVSQDPSVNQPLPSNRTFTLSVSNGSPQRPDASQARQAGTPPAAQAPEETQPESAPPSVWANVIAQLLHPPKNTHSRIADIRVSNTLLEEPPFQSGERVRFQIAVTNAGPSPATGVDLNLEPTNLEITGVSGDCNSEGCSFGKLERVDGRTITVDGVISGKDGFSLEATARHAEADPNSNNNEALAGGPIQQPPPPQFARLSVNNDLYPKSPHHLGDNIEFRVQVNNIGAGVARNVKIDDALSNLQLHLVKGDCTQLPCIVDSLQPNAELKFLVSAEIIGVDQFTSRVTAMSARTKPVSASAGDKVVVQSAELSITNMLLNQNPLRVGGDAEFRVTVLNKGQAAANDVQVTDDFSNLKLVRVDGACTHLPCALASIPPGVSVNLVVHAMVLAEGQLSSTVTATSAQTKPVSAVANSGALAPQVADLSVSNTLVNQGLLRVGDDAKFRVTVLNKGQATVNDVQVMASFSNLKLVRVEGACTHLPCALAGVSLSAPANLVVHATILAEGQFSSTVTAMSALTQPVSTSASGSIPPLPLWKKIWDWIKGRVAAAAGGALALIILAGWGATFARRAWWRPRIKTKVGLDRMGSTRVSDPLPTSAPSVSLYVHLEPGSAGPDGKIPVLKEEVCRD